MQNNHSFLGQVMVRKSSGATGHIISIFPHDLIKDVEVTFELTDRSKVRCKLTDLTDATPEEKARFRKSVPSPFDES